MSASIKIWLLGFLLALASDGVVQAKIAQFNLDGSGAVLSGYWPQGNDQGRIFVGGGNGSQLDASVVGTAVELTCYSTDASSITVTVDGVVSTPSFSITNAFTTLQIELGAEGTHSLTIKQPYLTASFYLDTGAGGVNGATFTIHGQAPSIGPPASGFGPQYQLNDPINVTPYIQAEGGLAQIDESGYPAIYHDQLKFADEALYFTASTTGTIQAWVYGGAGAVSLYIDGVKTGLLFLPHTYTYQWVTLFTGDGTRHRYGVAEALTNTSGLFIWSLMTVGGTLSPVTTAPRPAFIAYGDSITQAQLGSDDDSSMAYAARVGVSLGWAVYNRGISGSTVHQFPSGKDPATTEAGEGRTAAVTSVAAGARGLCILYGTNDMNQAGGPESIAEFQASYQNMLTQIVAGVPSTCSIVCVGNLPRINYTPNTIAIWNAAMQAAIAAVGAPNVRYAEPSGWGLLQNNGPDANYTDVNGNTLDGLHPNGAGYAILASNILPYFAPPGAPAITSTYSDAAQVGIAHAYQITASNAPTSFNTSELPAGLALDPVTGLISGVPMEEGTATVVVSATNATGAGTAAFTLIVAAGVPSVTVMTAGDGMAVEGRENGKAVVRRTGDTSANLTVIYKVKGSAAAGVDYRPVSGTVTIPAGSATAKIKIKPIGSETVDGTPVAKIKLLPPSDGSYVLGDTILAKIRIIGND